MSKARVKFYVDRNTQMIHRVGLEFGTQPRRMGHTNCGRPVINLFQCTGDLSRVAPFRFCLKCIQLTGG